MSEPETPTVPTLTYDQVKEIASRGGTVRWKMSGVVEKLKLNNKDKIVADGAATRGHTLKDNKRHPTYRCEEVPAETPMENLEALKEKFAAADKERAAAMKARHKFKQERIAQETARKEAKAAQLAAQAAAVEKKATKVKPAPPVAIAAAKTDLPPKRHPRVDNNRPIEVVVKRGRG